ncbi:helix-turn-helix transcriptional regulator [Paenibacillus koleovorans]|uniref:helix-turn-helix transcriptional regulator n=1 Tax=Paenibacillus koleovorans TaxID=121608 RepID=UPI000FD8100F|nr:AraC family transcriptional regulator [Paenibacillus koleovorans]
MYLTETGTSYDLGKVAVKRMRKPHYYMDSHWHPHFEITYLIDGKRRFFVKERAYSMSKGEMIFIAPQDIHRTMDAETSPYEKIELSFHSSWIAPHRHSIPPIDLLYTFIQQDRVLRFLPEEQQYVESILFRIMYEAKHQPVGFEQEIVMLVKQLLLFAARLALQPLEHHLSNGSMQANIAHMLRFINVHFREPLQLHDLASRFHFNANYLSSRFKQLTGFTYVEYLNSLRIKEAQRLLCHTGSDITEIALQTGFTNTTHFGRVFKSMNGMSPSAYRKLKKDLQ